jgi:hypothetical protein
MLSSSQLTQINYDDYLYILDRLRRSYQLISSLEHVLPIDVQILDSEPCGNAVPTLSDLISVFYPQRKQDQPHPFFVLHVTKHKVWKYFDDKLDESFAIRFWRFLGGVLCSEHAPMRCDA